MWVDRLAEIFVGLAIVAVIVLKLTNVLTISWLWILSPIWIPLALGFVLALIILFLAIITPYDTKKEYEK